MSAQNGNELFDEIPDDGWDLNQLGSFCLRATRRSGRVAWLVGKALNAARPKAKAEKRRWMPWIEEHCQGENYKTLSRYRRLAEILPEPPPADETLCESYVRAGLKKE
jgi:hypothetical protein